MKATVQTKNGIQLQETAKPTPGNNEVLVKVYAATVTAGDVVLGNLPGFMFWSPVRKVLGIPPKKQTPGHEFSGKIAAVGKDVTRFKPGDSVFGTTTGLTTGANAEYVCVPESWETGVIATKPANLSHEQASTVPVGGMTALYFLKQANIQHGQKVLIYGASGSVGTYAVQLARYFGAEVTGVCSSRNIGLVKSLGAHQVIDYTKEDLAQNQVTYDVIFDAVGKLSSAQRKIMLRENGHYVSIRSTSHETTQALLFLKELVEAGELSPVIDRCYPLEKIAEAYQYVATGHKQGNVVIAVDHDNTLTSNGA